MTIWKMRPTLESVYLDSNNNNLGQLNVEYLEKIKSKMTPGKKMIEEAEKIEKIEDPNVPFVNHWKDQEKIGFNRELTAKEIHECFKDNDGQGKIFEKNITRDSAMKHVFDEKLFLASPTR